eukprot:489169_1
MTNDDSKSYTDGSYRNGSTQNGKVQGLNGSMIDDLSDFEPSKTKSISESDALKDIDDDIGPATATGRQNTESLIEPSLGYDPNANTSRKHVREAQKEYVSDKKKKTPFVIRITPPTGETPTEEDPTDNETDYEEPKKKEKVDPTLGGKISWKKVADFSALLPRDVKLKLWNGVFKNEADKNQHERKKISKVLRTFVMLQLTREYKKSNETVPNDLKTKLPAAVKEPSNFLSQFLKKDEKFIDQAFLTIYDTICEKFKTNDDSKKAKYAKKK